MVLLVDSLFGFVSTVHDFGLYIPNHHGLSEQDIEKITDIVNEVTDE